MRYALILLILLFASTARAEDCSDPSTCVPAEDMEVFVQLLKEKRCLQESEPRFEFDPIEIVTDKDGRVYFSGAKPKPYTLRMNWCDYEVTAEGKLNVVAAMMEPPIWSFRFRPKAYAGILWMEPFQENKTLLEDGIDAGLMVDFFHVYDFNLNVAVGWRSVGLGIGYDIFRSFGVYTGYSLAWQGFGHNVQTSLWFAFW